MYNITLNSAATSTQKPRRVTAGPTAISPKRLGDLAEQWVTMLCAWKGCEVFRNANTTGPTDLIISHPELGLLEVDVKCMVWKPSANDWTNTHTGLGDCPKWPVSVKPVGDFADWKVSWVRGRCPQGWEDFWTNDNRFYRTTSTQPSDA